MKNGKRFAPTEGHAAAIALEEATVIGPKLWLVTAHLIEEIEEIEPALMVPVPAFIRAEAYVWAERWYDARALGQRVLKSPDAKATPADMDDVKAWPRWFVRWAGHAAGLRPTLRMQARRANFDGDESTLWIDVRELFSGA